ncbi:MAG: hypothetical protein RML12_02390 [Xanthomonadales bacterium]|nr:hypothetical protein [Xanthomonadales bacterium]
MAESRETPRRRLVVLGSRRRGEAEEGWRRGVEREAPPALAGVPPRRGGAGCCSRCGASPPSGCRMR